MTEYERTSDCFFMKHLRRNNILQLELYIKNVSGISMASIINIGLCTQWKWKYLGPDQNASIHFSSTIHLKENDIFQIPIASRVTLTLMMNSLKGIIFFHAYMETWKKDRVTLMNSKEMLLLHETWSISNHFWRVFSPTKCKLIPLCIKPECHCQGIDWGYKLNSICTLVKGKWCNLQKGQKYTGINRVL